MNIMHSLNSNTAVLFKCGAIYSSSCEEEIPQKMRGNNGHLDCRTEECVKIDTAGSESVLNMLHAKEKLQKIIKKNLAETFTF